MVDVRSYVIMNVYGFLTKKVISLQEASCNWAFRPGVRYNAFILGRQVNIDLFLESAHSVWQSISTYTHLLQEDCYFSV